MNGAQAQVLEFHRAMSLSAPEGPAPLDSYNGELRVSLIDEEAAEFRAAWERRDRIAMIDALCDIVYVAYGAAVEMGIDLEPFFDEVHRSNMEKTGGAVRRDGKQLKPDGWEPPAILSLYERLYGSTPVNS